MTETGKASTSGMAIAALVVAIIAALTSALPIVNNISFFLALISLVLAIVALLGIKKGKHSGKGIGIAGLVLSVVAIVVVLASQSMYADMLSGPEVESAETSQSASDESQQQGSASSGASAAADFSNLKVGESATFDNGLVVTVDKVETGLTNYDDSAVTGITVTYQNNGESNASFNALDWKAEDAKGAQRGTTYYDEASDELNSGELSAGGSVTGNLYFEGAITKVHYYSDVFSDSSSVAWAVEE